MAFSSNAAKSRSRPIGSTDVRTLDSVLQCRQMAGVEIAHPAELRSQMSVGDKVTKHYPAIRSEDFHVRLELPPQPGSELPYSGASEFRCVSLDRLTQSWVGTSRDDGCRNTHPGVKTAIAVNEPREALVGGSERFSIDGKGTYRALPGANGIFRREIANPAVQVDVYTGQLCTSG
jgi:hypothetical protein